jgi:hypothetical protein
VCGPPALQLFKVSVRSLFLFPRTAVSREPESCRNSQTKAVTRLPNGLLEPCQRRRARLNQTAARRPTRPLSKARTEDALALPGQAAPEAAQPDLLHQRMAEHFRGSGRHLAQAGPKPRSVERIHLRAPLMSTTTYACRGGHPSGLPSLPGSWPCIIIDAIAAAQQQLLIIHLPLHLPRSCPLLRLPSDQPQPTCLRLQVPCAIRPSTRPSRRGAPQPRHITLHGGRLME